MDPRYALADPPTAAPRSFPKNRQGDGSLVTTPPCRTYGSRHISGVVIVSVPCSPQCPFFSVILTAGLELVFVAVTMGDALEFVRTVGKCSAIPHEDPPVRRDPAAAYERAMTFILTL